MESCLILELSLNFFHHFSGSNPISETKKLPKILEELYAQKGPSQYCL